MDKQKVRWHVTMLDVPPHTPTEYKFSRSLERSQTKRGYKGDDTPDSLKVVPLDYKLIKSSTYDESSYQYLDYE